MQKLSLAFKNFNNKIQQMNQTGSRQLMLTADEARNLHADIYVLLANLAEMQTAPESEPTSETFMDGGGFK
jgi:hypothetical protein